MVSRAVPIRAVGVEITRGVYRKCSVRMAVAMFDVAILA